MFIDAIAFNQPLQDWDINNVTNVSQMFYHAISFNQPSSSWNTCLVTTMAAMFKKASNLVILIKLYQHGIHQKLKIFAEINVC